MAQAHSEFSDTANGEPIGLTVDWWLTRDIPPEDYLVGQWLTTTSRVLLTAPTGIGKTNFLMAIAAHLGVGIDFLHWRIPRPRRVLYVDGEMSCLLLKQRIEDAVQRLGGAHPSAMYVFSHEDVEKFEPLNTPTGRQFILTLIEELGAEAVIFDNIMALIAGDMKEEQGWRDTLPLVDALSKKRVGQIWAHHTGHDASHSYGTKTREWRMDTTILGKKVERAGVDVSFMLQFDKARTRTPLNRRDFTDVTVALVNDKWVGDIAAKVLPDKPSPLGMKFMQALQDVLNRGGIIKFQGRDAVKMDKWRDECMVQGLLDETKKNSTRSMLSQYRRELIACNLIACHDDTVWVIHAPDWLQKGPCPF
jgi:hypothetical protein